MFDVQAEYNKRLKEILLATKPTFIIPASWFENALNALRFTSPMALGIMGAELLELKDLLENFRKPNCYQFAILNNNLEARSAVDLNLNLNEYIDMIVKTEALSQAWNTQTEPLRHDLSVNLVEEQKKLNAN